jgi:hypothetical protein
MGLWNFISRANQVVLSQLLCFGGLHTHPVGSDLLDFTVIPVRREVLHVFFFARTRTKKKNKLERVSFVSEMDKPGIQQGFCFFVLQGIVSGSGPAGILGSRLVKDQMRS